MNPINCAIIGCGVISPTHALCLHELTEARLVAVCDSVEDKALKLAETYPAEVYTDYKAVLERPDIDLVCVCTPSGLHAEVGIAAALAGKHVIVEKPIDIGLESAQALVAACKKAGVKLSCILQHRFDPAVIDLKAALKEGLLGELHFGGAHTQWYRAAEYYAQDAWRNVFGGGSLINQSVHYIDLLQYVMGPVAEVHAYAGNRSHPASGVDDIAAAVVKFRSGAMGVIESMTCAWPGFATRLEVFGEDGGVVLENDRVKEWKLRSGSQPSGSFQGGAVIAGSSSVDIWHQAHKRQIQDVLEAVRDNRDPLVSGEDGLAALEIILAMYQSAHTRAPVLLPLGGSSTALNWRPSF